MIWWEQFAWSYETESDNWLQPTLTEDKQDKLS